MGGYCWEAFHKVEHLGQTPDVSEVVQVCLSESLHMYCKLTTAEPMHPLLLIVNEMSHPMPKLQRRKSWSNRTVLLMTTMPP